MQIKITNTTGSWDVTSLVPTVRWSGDYRQAARTLSFSLLSSPSDEDIPVVECPVGTAVTFSENGETLFSGKIITRTKSTEGSTLDLICMDRGFDLMQNHIFEKFPCEELSKSTPEAVTRYLAEKFGFAVGDLAHTGVEVARNFTTGRDTLYSAMRTMYLLAAQTTGEACHIGFRGEKLYVTAKEPDDRTLILQGKSNLISATTTESMSGMVSAVEIYDLKGNLANTMEDGERIGQYGRLQRVLVQNKQDDKAAEAKKLLEDHGISQSITVNALGNIACVAGGTVVVREPYTGLYGLFFIDSDVHEWKRGQYYNKLTLNYNAMMEESQAGSLPNADGRQTASSGSSESGSSSSGAWDYHNEG